MLFIGIDPGLSGAICVLDLNDNIRFVDFTDIDFFESGAWLLEAVEQQKVTVYLESPSMRPGNARGSDFKAAMNYGQILSSLKCYGFTPIEIRPQDWQKPMKLKTKSKERKKHKQEIASKVKDRYPEAEIYGPRGGIKDGRSDALGIANHGKNLFYWSK